MDLHSESIIFLRQVESANTYSERSGSGRKRMLADVRPYETRRIKQTTNRLGPFPASFLLVRHLTVDIIEFTCCSRFLAAIFWRNSASSPSELPYGANHEPARRNPFRRQPSAAFIRRPRARYNLEVGTTCLFKTNPPHDRLTNSSSSPENFWSTNAPSISSCLIQLDNLQLPGPETRYKSLHTESSPETRLCGVKAISSLNFSFLCQKQNGRHRIR